MDIKQLAREIKQTFPDVSSKIAFGELTITVPKQNIKSICQALKNNFHFDVLIDITGVDYLSYGKDEWRTDVSSKGFGRARHSITQEQKDNKRFAVIYHLLSVSQNYRIRVKTFLDDNLKIDSVIDVWSGANWYEREAFDLFGFLFKGHPDLRRILTDYGFVGHPLRKDFPTSGEVQVRYDNKQKRVIYEPVDIVAEVNVPKVIRES